MNRKLIRKFLKPRG